MEKSIYIDGVSVQKLLFHLPVQHIVHGVALVLHDHITGGGGADDGGGGCGYRDSGATNRWLG